MDAALHRLATVFQLGWGSQLLGIDHDLPIPAFVPMPTFAIVFGLSMDCEVVLLSRVRDVAPDRRRAPRGGDRASAARPG